MTEIDWANLPAWVATLDMQQRTELRWALDRADSADREPAILDHIRQVLTDNEIDPATVVAVLFGASEYDNGFFLDYSGTVYLSDGETEMVDFGDETNELFTDEYGIVGPNFTVTVDLATDKIDNDDHGEFATMNLEARAAKLRAAKQNTQEDNPQ
jgi:hypothetical protein